MGISCALNSRLFFLQRIKSAIWQLWTSSQSLSFYTTSGERGFNTELSYTLFSKCEAMKSKQRLRGSFALF